jgi:hypothetical protein
MLNSELRIQYQQLLADCDKVLFHHPQRSMAECLQAIIPLAEQCAQVDCYSKGALVN